MKISNVFFDEFVKSMVANSNNNTILCVNPLNLRWGWFDSLDNINGGWDYVFKLESVTFENVSKELKKSIQIFGGLEIENEIQCIKLRDKSIEGMLISAHDSVQSNEGYEGIGINLIGMSYILIPSIKNVYGVYNYILPFNAVKAISSDEFITIIAQMMHIDNVE